MAADVLKILSYSFCGLFNDAFTIEIIYRQMTDELERTRKEGAVA
jgi:hypothetical protein